MEQWPIFLIVGLIALVKWLMENSGKFQGDESDDIPDPDPSQRNRPASPRPPRPNAGAFPGGETEEERMRRFMEALGLPKEGVPPPRPAPRKAAPVKPDIRHLGRPIPAPAAARRTKISPPLETGGPLPTLPKTASVGETAPSMEVTSIPQMTFGEPLQVARSVAVEVSSAVTQPSPRPAPKKPPRETAVQAALQEQLRDPASLRRAILLREILGAPKGLQSAQSPSIFSPL